MAEEKHEHYGIEPGAAAPEAGAQAPRRVDVPRSTDSTPLPLEGQPSARGGDDDSDRPSSPKELDVCPNCGASMRGAETLVCLRCGFDLKTMRVIDAARRAASERRWVKV